MSRLDRRSVQEIAHRHGPPASRLQHIKDDLAISGSDAHSAVRIKAKIGAGCRLGRRIDAGACAADPDPALWPVKPGPGNRGKGTDLPVDFDGAPLPVDLGLGRGDLAGLDGFGIILRLSILQNDGKGVDGVT